MNHKEFFMFVQLIIKELLYVCQISYSDKGFRRFCLFLLYHESCGILLPWPRPSAVIAWSPNRWTIRETPQISLTFGLRCEEEKGFVLQQWVLLSAFTLRKMKENLCNFFLFCEHIRALLFSCICGFLAIFRLGRGGGCCDCWSCENVKLDNIWNAKLQSIQSLLKKKKNRESSTSQAQLCRTCQRIRLNRTPGAPPYHWVRGRNVGRDWKVSEEQNHERNS